MSRRELAAVLWEEKPYTRQRQRQLQTLIGEMKRALREAGAGEMVRQEAGRLFLVPEKVDCDYYRFMQWDAAAVNAYRGEYMTEYSWAEFTAGALSQKAMACPAPGPGGRPGLSNEKNFKKVFGPFALVYILRYRRPYNGMRRG